MSAFQPRYTAEELYLMKQLAAQKLDRAVTCKESLEHASIASYTSPPPLIHSAHASSYNSSTSSPEETPDHGHGVERGISILELKELTRLRLLNELNSSVSPRAPASASVYHSAFSANPLGNRPVSVTEAIRSSAKYGLPPDQCYHITDYGSLLTTGPMLVRQPLHVNPPPLVSSQHDPNTWCTSSFPYIGPPSLRRHSLPEFSTFSDYNFNRDTSPFELFTEEGASQLHALKTGGQQLDQLLGNYSGLMFQEEDKGGKTDAFRAEAFSPSDPIKRYDERGLDDETSLKTGRDETKDA